MHLPRPTILLLAAAGFLCPGSAGAADFIPLQPELVPGFRPASSGVEAGIWMQVEDFEHSVKHSPNRIRDPLLDAYILDLVCRMAPDYCGDIRVYVMRVPHFNATMMPNGTMQVWTGLLLRMRNEAQLAAVLGHEMGHYLRRHSVKRFEDAKLKSNLLTFLSLGMAGAVAAGGVSADTGRTAIDLTQFTMLASIFAYNRSNEREADQFGAQLVHGAGMDPGEAAAVWSNLIAEEEAADHKRPSPLFFFRSHPDPGERTQTLSTYARHLADGGDVPAADLQPLHEVLAPHMEMMLEDDLNLRQFGRSEFLLKALAAERVAPGPVMFALGELYRLRGEDGDAARALQHYEQAVAEPDHPETAHRSLGLIYYKQRDLERARRQFGAYLEKTPQAHDREMIEFYLASGV